MKLPKFAMVSDGKCTAALLDGVSIGRGIKRLDFSASGGRSTIKIMELDIEQARLSLGEKEFLRIAEGLAKERDLIQELQSGKTEE